MGTGQPLTCYNTMYGGPRQPGEADGPEEYHVVLLDNHRTELLADAEQRDALHCIRCGACLNVCPIFRNVGGHTYGTTYSGPIGSVITPHLRGLQDWKHLSLRVVALRRLHRDVPGENRSAPSPAAKPPQRFATETELVAEARVQDFRAHRDTSRRCGR